MLLQKNADINVRGGYYFTALFTALSQRNLQMIKLLFIHYEYEEPNIAPEQGYDDILKYLLKIVRNSVDPHLTLKTIGDEDYAQRLSSHLSRFYLGERWTYLKTTET